MFKKIGAWFKAVFALPWVKQIIQTVKDLLLETIAAVGKDVVEKIKAKIQEVAQDPALDNKAKFSKVFDYVRGLVPGLKDSAINLLIESLYNSLKQAGKV